MNLYYFSFDVKDDKTRMNVGNILVAMRHFINFKINEYSYLIKSDKDFDGIYEDIGRVVLMLNGNSFMFCECDSSFGFMSSNDIRDFV